MQTTTLQEPRTVGYVTARYGHLLCLPCANRLGHLRRAAGHYHRTRYERVADWCQNCGESLDDSLDEYNAAHGLT